MTADEYKRRRAELGHTQQTLAEALGVARETIARRETGAIPITTEAALALSALLKIKRRGAPRNIKFRDGADGRPPSP